MSFGVFYQIFLFWHRGLIAFIKILQRDKQPKKVFVMNTYFDIQSIDLETLNLTTGRHAVQRMLPRQQKMFVVQNGSP